MNFFQRNTSFNFKVALTVIKAAVRLQASVINKTINYRSSISDINPVKLICKKGTARTVKSLFKVNLQAVVYSLQLYQKETFPTQFLPRNFQSNCSFEHLLREDSERMHSKASLTWTMKASKNQMKTFACVLQIKRSD